MTDTETQHPNVDLLRQTMDAILANPERHRQELWASRTACGTAYCFAGWACVLSGFEANADELDRWGDTNNLSGGGEISEKAQLLLGISYDDRCELFAGDNTTADLKHYVDQICEHGRIVEPVVRNA